MLPGRKLIPSEKLEKQSLEKFCVSLLVAAVPQVPVHET
jgi:hypothetical protein